MTATLAPPATDTRERVGVRWLPAVAVAVVALVLALPAAALSGAVAPQLLGDAGPVVRWGLVVNGAIHNVAAASTIGLLVVGGFFAPESRTSRRRATAAVSAATVACIWAACAVVNLLLGFANASTLAMTSSAYWKELRTGLVDLELVRLWGIEVAMVLAVVLLSALVRTRAGLAWAATLALGTLIPVAYTGHSSSTSGHETAVTALGIHLFAVSTWVGGLIALVMLRPVLGSALTVTVQRFSTLALWCFVAVAFSGPLFALDTIESPSQLLSGYWLLIWCKISVLGALGVFGYIHRKRLIEGGLERTGAFARLASVETLVMAIAMGLSVALSRTPPPELVAIDESSPAELLTGYPEPPPLTPEAFLSVWQVNWLTLLAALLAIGVYLAGARRMRARGDHWPMGRTVAWLIGWSLVIYVTNGAPGAYGRVMFSMHMVMHMALMMAIPIFLVLAAPITLGLRTLRARRDKTLGPREVLLAIVHSRYAAIMANPVVAAVVFFGSLVGFYWTPAFNFALTTHTGHVLMMVHFTMAGYLFVWSLIGIDPGPPKWSAPLRLLVLLATLAAHAFFGLALMSGTWLLAPEFFKEIKLSWGPDLLEDQQLGGAIAWGVGEMPTLALALLVTLDWMRRDEREAVRSDRQAERDDDAELAAYNARLATMTQPGSRKD